MNHSPIVVVGACNLDIYATSAAELIPADSNPGSVYTTLGGVGRNIAENLARLGCKINMLTAIGQDAFADAILKNADEAGMDLSNALRLPHLSTSVYVCINKPDGDIGVAVSDMDISQKITPDYLFCHTGQLKEAQLIVAETNLSQETLHALWEKYAAKLCIDCVSEPKSSKAISVLEGLYCLKANRGEASVVTGLPVTTVDEAKAAATELHAKGVQHVIITLGEYGALISNGSEMLSMPLMPGETRNTSGCGDAFFAGALSAFYRHKDLNQALRSGLAMSRICACANTAVASNISPELLERTIQTYQGGTWK